MPPAHLFYYRARGLGAGGQTQWGYAVAVAAVSSSRTAVRSPRRLPVAGSTPQLSRTPSPMRNLSSERRRCRCFVGEIGP